MSDGAKANIGQILTDISEAVVKPVTDEVGKAIEEGTQSIVGSGQYSQNPPNPAEQQKKKLEEQKRKDWALRVIDWNSAIQSQQQKIRQENQQKINQQNQEEQETKKVKQFQVMERQEKRQQLSQSQLAERKAEVKRGVGG